MTETTPRKHRTQDIRVEAAQEDGSWYVLKEGLDSTVAAERWLRDEKDLPEADAYRIIDVKREVKVEHETVVKRKLV